ncbi:MAG: esterase [Cytophagaceae bacterium]|nr:esterase [Cytophagaceae bacterium]
MARQKRITYTTTNTYHTLNTITKDTENIWFVIHGLGYLSKYFIKHFEPLDAKKNFIVAPQAPSKYYQDKAYKYVGACWLTREERDLEMENNINYLNTLYIKEIEPYLTEGRKLYLLGFSQGVSILTRWLARTQVDFKTLYLHSGKLPDNLSKKDFEFIKPGSKVEFVYGNNDELITEKRLKDEKNRLNDVFTDKIHICSFNGKHEFNSLIFNDLI